MNGSAKDARSPFEIEVQEGARFEFGKNWQRFLKVLTPERTHTAEAYLREMLGVDNLVNQTFLDVGSGSGLSSLAARNLGATVLSFDFDPSSVACTRELRARYHSDDPSWQIREGSVLNPAFLTSLGQYDVVYSWGVLHHTGKMWEALDHVAHLVRPGGMLFLAIYNNQGRASRLWRTVKQWYCSGPVGQAMVSSLFIPYFFVRTTLACALRKENFFVTHAQLRGMSVWYDWVDWLGGYPFEVARAEEIFTFYQQKGFTLKSMRLTSSGGNNEFVFLRTGLSPAGPSPSLNTASTIGNAGSTGGG